MVKIRTQMVGKDVFPRRNLPGDAEQWGRSVESRIEAGEDSETQLTQVVNNMGRATAGQLAVISNQMKDILLQQDELLRGRKTVTGSTDARRFTYNAPTGSHLIGAIPISVPSPVGGSRSAIPKGYRSNGFVYATTRDRVSGDSSDIQVSRTGNFAVHGNTPSSVLRTTRTWITSDPPPES